MNWRLKRFFGSLKYRVYTLRSELAYCYSSHFAEYFLNTDAPIKILVDSSIYGHAITHQPAWISTGPPSKLLPDRGPGYLARIPVHSPGNKTSLYRNIRYLPGLIRLAEKGFIEFYISEEIRAEMWGKGGYNFLARGLFDYSLMPETLVKEVGKFTVDPFGEKQEQYRRVSKKIDEPFNSIRKKLNPKHSLDCWHLHTAETENLDFFLTIDFKFLKAIQHANSHDAIPKTLAKAISPEELGKKLRIAPIHTAWLTHRDLSWAGEPTLHMPGESKVRYKR